MLVGKFESDPERKPNWAWLEDNLTPKGYHFKTDVTSFLLLLFLRSNTKSVIYTPKRDEHGVPYLFTRGLPSPSSKFSQVHSPVWLPLKANCTKGKITGNMNQPLHTHSFCQYSAGNRFAREGCLVDARGWVLHVDRRLSQCRRPYFWLCFSSISFLFFR